MIAVCIQGIYKYVSTVLCPTLFQTKKRVTFHTNLIENISLLDSIDELYDKNDDYNGMIYNTVGKRSMNNYNNFGKYRNNRTTDRQKNSHLLKKNNSYNVINYYCGFCSQYIDVPEHMYCDKPYCSIECRTNQHNLDTSTIVRDNHSFSI